MREWNILVVMCLLRAWIMHHLPWWTREKETKLPFQSGAELFYTVDRSHHVKHQPIHPPHNLCMNLSIDFFTNRLRSFRVYFQITQTRFFPYRSNFSFVTKLCAFMLAEAAHWTNAIVDEGWSHPWHATYLIIRLGGWSTSSVDWRY